MFRQLNFFLVPEGKNAFCFVAEGFNVFFVLFIPDTVPGLIFHLMILVLVQCLCLVSNCFMTTYVHILPLKLAVNFHAAYRVSHLADK